MDLAQFLIGGAAGRPDSVSGMNPDFRAALTNMFAAAPGGLQIKSGYRSPELQAQLYDRALAKYGSPEAARRWVAPPGRSQHNHGMAADLSFATPDALRWAHENAANYGLTFPLSNENWHIEMSGARGGQAKPSGGAISTAASQAAPAPVVDAPLTAAGPEGNGGQLMTGLASMFLRNQAMRQQRQQEEQAAEEARRQALFTDLASLYG